MLISWPLILFLNVKDAVNLVRYLIDSYRISVLIRKYWRTNSLVIDHNRPRAVLNNIFPSCNFHIRGNRLFFDPSSHLALGVNHGFVVDSRQFDETLHPINSNEVGFHADELVLIGAESATSYPKLFLAGTFPVHSNPSNTSKPLLIGDRILSFVQLYYVSLRLRWFLKSEMLNGRKAFLAFTTASKYSFMFLPQTGAASRRVSATTHLTRRKQDVILMFGHGSSTAEKTCVSDALNGLLNSAKYTLYVVGEEESISLPWAENCELFIAAFDETDCDVSRPLTHYLNKGGKLLCLSSSFSNKISAMRTANSATWNYIFPGFSYSKVNSNLGLLESALKSLAIDVSKAELSLSSSLVHSRGFLLSRNSFDAASDCNSNGGFSVVFGSETGSSSKSRLSCDAVSNVNEYVDFDYDAFESYVRNFNKMNHSLLQIPAVLHVPVLDSTMPVAKALEPRFKGQQGLMVVADVQLGGQGRRQNKWISNSGCVMTSFSYTSSSSAVGQEESDNQQTTNLLISQSPSALQHIVAMAVVKAIKELAPIDLAVGIKWPNDIYYNREVKLGGVLVTAECDSHLNMKFTIGIGINLNNEEPTLCVNQIIRNLRAPPPTTVDDNENLQSWTISREHLLAAIYCHFFKLMSYCSQHGFDESVIRQYCDLWIHADQQVTYLQEQKHADGKTTQFRRAATVVGINSDGFLLVRTPTNEMIELHPDGNRFDLTKNLLYKA